MRPAQPRGADGIRWMPSFSDFRGLEVFYFQALVLVSQPLTRLAIFFAKHSERSAYMSKLQVLSLALASLFVSIQARAQFAESVISYDPGAGFSPGFTNAEAALGEPSRITPGTFGGPVDPFDPAYLTSQLVSIGAAGSLTLKFSKPILDHPRNRFGIDFIIFGNAGFIITNAFDLETFNWIGTPATDGSLFGNNPGASRVSVSSDGITFYELNPAVAAAAVVDGLLPTEGSGDFHTPADPSLRQTDFSGLTLEGIRALYYGSAGGTGYDLAWAQDSEGKPISIHSIRYVRLEILEGKAEVDGIAVVFVTPGLRP